MPLKAVTKPDIAIPLTPEGDVLLRVVSIPNHAALALYNALEPTGMRIGTLGHIVLEQCLLAVEGTVLDEDEQEVTDVGERLRIARQAAILNSEALGTLTAEVLAHLRALPGNWREASGRALEAIASQHGLA